MDARIRKAQLLFISLIHEITGSKLPLRFRETSHPEVQANLCIITKTGGREIVSLPVNFQSKPVASPPSVIFFTMPPEMELSANGWE